jgi:hypothetical protein
MKEKQQKQPFPGTPGVYRVKVASWLPQLKVQVFKDSLQKQDEWRCRIAGLVINPQGLLTKNWWEGPLNQ